MRKRSQVCLFVCFNKETGRMKLTFNQIGKIIQGTDLGGGDS